LLERRRELHARIVTTMETLWADRIASQVEPLAHHASRGAVWDKAVTYQRQAGVKALERSASREATAFFEQALEALEHLRSVGTPSSRRSTSGSTCVARSCLWPTASGSSTTCRTPRRWRASSETNGG